MTPKEILNASFIEVIEESLLNDSSFYAKMSLKHGGDKEKEKEQLDLSQKYYDSLEWFNSLMTKIEKL